MSPKNQVKQPANSLFEKRLSSYALATASVLAVPASIAAAPIYVPVDVTVNQPGTYSFNLSGPASADITVSATGGFIPANVTFNGVSVMAVAGSGILNDSMASPAALAFGALIDPAQTASFGSGGKMASYNSAGAPGNWPIDGSDAYLGLLFCRLERSAGGVGAHCHDCERDYLVVPCDRLWVRERREHGHHRRRR